LIPQITRKKLMENAAHQAQNAHSSAVPAFRHEAFRPKSTPPANRRFLRLRDFDPLRPGIWDVWEDYSCRTCRNGDNDQLLSVPALRKMTNLWKDAPGLSAAFHYH
jgi:hypothetical protein